MRFVILCPKFAIARHRDKRLTSPTSAAGIASIGCIQQSVWITNS